MAEGIGGGHRGETVC
jgi:rSAM/selenodomain-associated transferase 2